MGLTNCLTGAAASPLFYILQCTAVFFLSFSSLFLGGGVRTHKSHVPARHPRPFFLPQVHFDQIIGEDALMSLEPPNNHFTFAAVFAIKGAAARNMWFHPKQTKLNDRKLCPEGP